MFHRQAPRRKTPAFHRRKRPTFRALFESLEERTLLSFGYTDTGSNYVVDTGANLVFTVAKSAPSGGNRGDLTSTKYNGTELEAPFSATSRYSHYESGLSATTTVSATQDPNGQWILITCNDLSGTGVIQYYIARKGQNNIYMATYSPGPDSPSPGEMRFIMYSNHSILTSAPAPSNNTGNTGAIESSDVFGHADGTTSSKYYGEYRAIDTQTYGLTGGGFGLFMNIGNRETSSGGPFFKDIDYQTTSSQSTELYTYTFSGHSQTENFRPGLKGPYALQFTTGATPAAPDYSFIEGLNLTGYIPTSQRGTLTGTASGVPSSLQATVALSNSTAQYWALPNPTTGSYTITGIMAGTYTETLYQGELAVGNVQVTINAGATTKQNIVNTNNYYEIDQNSSTVTTPVLTNQIFRIGTWDGTPLGLLNADKITTMHPTDSRMSPWAVDSTGVTNFTVGTDPDSAFPMAEWHTQVGTGGSFAPYVDTDNRITFTLTSSQAATPLTLRIGLTRLYYGRPTISINGHSSSIPNTASEPDSRGLTTGNWRGNNCIYTFNLSTSNLKTGINTIDIYCTSGSTGTYYSGYQIYDAIDLVPTSSITNAPVVKTVSVTPSTSTLIVGNAQQFTATAKDQSGNVIPANFVWSAVNGAIDGTGAYLAPAAATSDTITATSGSISGSASVTVNPNPDQIITGTSGNDTYYLRLSGSTVQVYPSSSPTGSPVLSQSYSLLHSLTFNTGGGNDTLIIDYANGSPIPSAGVSDAGSGNDTLQITNDPGTHSDAINISSGSVNLTSDNSSDTSNLLMTVAKGAALLLPTTRHLNSLTLNGSATLTPGANKVLVVHQLTINGGTLDVTNNSMIIDYTGASPIAAIQAALATGYNGSYWNGTGIVSSTAAADSNYLTGVGYAEASDVGTSSFAGQVVDDTSIVIRYTYYGDSNLDGAVTTDDLFALVAGFNGEGTGWVYGDFTYDNQITTDDIFVFNAGFNANSPPL